jgi:hypothetical protein
MSDYPKIDIVFSDGSTFSKDNNSPSWWKRLKLEILNNSKKAEKIKISLDGFNKFYNCGKYLYFMNKINKGNANVIDSVVHNGDNSCLLYFNTRNINNCLEMQSFSIATGNDLSYLTGADFSGIHLREKIFQIEEKNIGLIIQN